MNESLWNRIAAVSGLGFVGTIGATVILGEIKNLTTTADFVSMASNEVFGSASVLVSFGGLFFLWFLSGFVARLRELEGGSGRLATTTLAGGVIFAALLLAGNALDVAARNADPAAAAALTTLSQEIFYGPVLVFPIALAILAAGTVGTVTRGLPAYSAVTARLSILLADALLAMGSLWFFRDLAWLDETTMLAVLGWVAVVSVIGILRWGEPYVPASARTRPPDDLQDDVDEDLEATKLVREREGSSRRSGTRGRKPAARRAAPKRGSRRSR